VNQDEVFPPESLSETWVQGIQYKASEHDPTPLLLMGCIVRA